MFTGLSRDKSASFHALPALIVAGGGRLKRNADPVFVWTEQAAPTRKVALVSGGGAGHEPMHAGFVGQGGLDAAVPGEVFTSPHSRQIYEACKRVNRGEGVLQIVKNYTGDRINFAVAAERLRAEGARVEEVVIDDDIATDGTDIGRRGTGATVVVEKILGAAADRGLGLDELVALGDGVAAASRTVSVALRAHTSPGGSEPAFEVEPGTVEYGIGIHGEAAKDTLATDNTADVVRRMVDDLLAAVGDAPDGVIAFVNNLGGVSHLALAHVLTEVQAHLADRGVALRSAVAGTYITALDMTGFSVTLTAANPEWLDDWTASHSTDLPRPSLAVAPDAEGGESVERPHAEPSAWLQGFSEGLLALCDDLNALDQKAGDGDFGTNIRVGVEAGRAWATGPDADLATDLRSLAQAFSNDVGGSSGPLLGLLFTHTANATERGDSLASGVREGVRAITRVGGAQPGDRTLIDALHPAVFDGEAERDALDADAVRAAFDGAQATADMQGRRGRSSYLGDKVMGVPDPGALAAAWMVASLAEAESGQSHSQIRDEIAKAVSTDG